MTDWLVLVESNTTGSGRLFCRRARQRGLRPIVMARDPQRYPYLVADQVDYRVVDTQNPAAVHAACLDLDRPVKGVTSSSEYYIAVAAEVARALGRPHPDPAAIRACRDKAMQRARLSRAGVPGANAARADSPAGAVQAADRIGYPVVVKPVEGSGSVATRRCGGPDAVAQAAAQVLTPDQPIPGIPAQRAVMVEEYLAGPEYSVEVFDHEIVGITRKLLGPEPHFVETGHDFPAPLDAGVADEIRKVALAALKATGLGWGPAHVELRVTPTGPRIVELNPRLAGGMIPRLIEVATGLDLVALTVARAEGETALVSAEGTGDQPAQCDIAPPHRTASIRFLTAVASGRLVDVAGLEHSRETPGVVEVGLIRSRGEMIVVQNSFQDRVAYVIGVGADHVTAVRAAVAGHRALVIHVERA